MKYIKKRQIIKIRKQYDKYDEIITIILEQATSKFDDYVIEKLSNENKLLKRRNFLLL